MGGPMKELPKWAMGDPFKVYSRVEAMEQAQAARTPEAKAARAFLKIRETFKEEPDVKDNR